MSNIQEFDYQLDRHCSKTELTPAQRQAWFDYQLDRHCSKTVFGLLQLDSRFDYQLDRHCSKTGFSCPATTSSLITS